jgi:LysR family transcriptional regulator, low CO2-responsive transcriptional regulator
MTRSLNLHQLATFQVVAKHSSYVRAAEELHFSQPAVSAQIHLLEESLGVKLFDKIGRKTHLTRAGEELYLYSQKIFFLIDETLDAMEALRSPHYGRLSIGGDTTIGTYVIPGWLGKFHKLYPNVQVELEVTDPEHLIEALVNNRLDLVIMGNYPIEVPVFIAPVLSNELVLVAPPSHRLAERRAIPFAELSREYFLVREPGSGTRESLEAAFHEAGIPLQVSMQMGNNTAIKQGVAAGLGIALLSRVALDIELETRRLVILDVEGFPLLRQWRLVHLQQKHLSATDRAFKAFLLQQTDQLSPLASRSQQGTRARRKDASQ